MRLFQIPESGPRVAARERGRVCRLTRTVSVLDGLGDSGGPGAGLTKSELANVVKKLAPRWFLLRDAHAREGMMLLQPRWAISLMLGPMTGTEIRRAREGGIAALKASAPG